MMFRWQRRSQHQYRGVRLAPVRPVLVSGGRHSPILPLCSPQGANTEQKTDTALTLQCDTTMWPQHNIYIRTLSGICLSWCCWCGVVEPIFQNFHLITSNIFCCSFQPSDNIIKPHQSRNVSSRDFLTARWFRNTRGRSFSDLEGSCLGEQKAQVTK